MEIRIIPAVQESFVNGTNFSRVDDITNVSSATVANDNGTIRWVNNIDATNAQFDTAVIIRNDSVQVNTSLLSTTANSSAVIQIRGVSCPVSRISYIDNFSSGLSSIDIMGAGKDCVGFGVCSNLTCSGGIVSFTVSHFSGFAAGASANLTTGATGAQAAQPANFTALYINASNGDTILGASCNLSIQGLNIPLVNTTTGYNVTTTLVTNVGVVGYNITCAKSGFTTLVANDTVTMTAIPNTGSGSGGGGGGGRSSSRLGQQTQTPVAATLQNLRLPH